MDFKDLILQLTQRVDKMLPKIQTEEATKNALIMPFIQILGYDVFNPSEVNPEYIADIGIKKGEKVDYAIMKDNIPVILIECKHHSENLDLHNSQLFRYYHTSKAKFAILTNGIIFRFYTDLIEPNKMDEKPFLEVDLLNLKEQEITELKMFHKSYFDINNIFNSASELKYANEIKTILTNETIDPSVNFIKFFTSQVYSGPATQKVVTQFKDIVKRSFNQFISEKISDTLKTAMETEKIKEVEINKPVTTVAPEESIIVTTKEEIEAYFIVKSILRAKFGSNRIFYRDFQYFFSILLDDTIRQTICRLYLHENKKQIGIFDENKKETKYELMKLDDIYLYSDSIIRTTERLANGEKPLKQSENTTITST